MKLPIQLLGVLLPLPATLQQPDSGWTVIDPVTPGRTLVLPSAGFALRAGEALFASGDDGRYVLAARLNVPSPGRYRFVLEAEGGKGLLSLQGPVRAATTDATEWLELDGTSLTLSVEFARAARDVDARVRVSWERENDALGGFPPEPIPGRVALPLVEESRERHGRVLLELKGCTNCHAPYGLAPIVGTRRAPELDAAGTRLSASWMRRWISNPSDLRAHADMPTTLDDDADVEAIVHYLGTLTDEDLAPEPVATEEAVIAEGRRLYHTLGCLGCHEALAAPDAIFGETWDDRLLEVPSAHRFGDVDGKWNPVALARFVQVPAAVYPDGRMPSLDLEAEQADAIATYLATEWGVAEAFEPDPVLAARGAELFQSAGCSACHVEAQREPFASTPLGMLDRADCDFARYDLAAVERVAIEQALVGLPEGAGPPHAALAPAAYQARPAPLDAALRTIERLNCRACHAMDGRGGIHSDNDVYFISLDEHTDLGDEGRLPPDLSGVGWKLTTPWLREILTGERRSRPYLAARMPSYVNAGGLTEGLALLSGVHPNTDAIEVEATDELVAAGREMMGRTALGCVACHVYGDEPPSGSPGLALTGFGERLRYEWFRSFMMNPQRYRPGSRMPDFGRAGVSTLERVLDGDMSRQIEAMWAYFGLGEFMPVPDGIAHEPGLALVPRERPIVMRCYLETAGTRSVAVGTPLGLHYAVDARAARLHEVWRGGFLDLGGSWAGRGGNNLGGRGEIVWTAPDEPEVDLLRRDAGKAAPLYRGYRLDAGGTPTFLLDADGLPIELDVELAASPELVVLRRWSIANDGTLERIDVHAAEASCRIDGGPPEHGSSFAVPPDAREVELSLEVKP